MIKAHMESGLVAQLVEPRKLQGVHAGSGLTWHDGHLVAVQDHALSAGRIDPRTGKTQLIVFDAEDDPPSPDARPDFEAAVTADDGRVYILGSGSAETRRRIARLDFARHEVALISAPRFYEVVEQALGRTPCIEGAVLRGDVLRLFHRGSDARTDPSATVDLPASSLDGSGARSLSTTTFDLGSLDGVPFAFTDAAGFDDGRILYTAVASKGHSAHTEGVPLGVAVGVLDDTGARWTLLWEADGRPSNRGVEGVALDPGGESGWLITDPVRDEAPAVLCRLKLQGDW
jgi:hypothetical protein